MFNSIACMIVGDIISFAAAPAPDFFSSPIFGAIVGSTISAAVFFLGNWINYKQQQQRDKVAYDRQVAREELSHTRQVEREQVAYERSIKDAKRERLRSSYNVLLKMADEIQYEMQQLNHM